MWKSNWQARHGVAGNHLIRPTREGTPTVTLVGEKSTKGRTGGKAVDRSFRGELLCNEEREKSVISEHHIRKSKNGEEKSKDLTDFR